MNKIQGSFQEDFSVFQHVTYIDNSFIKIMAKYSKKAQKKVGKVMREYKKGRLKSGRGRQKVKSRKQAIAIGISEAKKKGYKVPNKKRKRK